MQSGFVYASGAEKRERDLPDKHFAGTIGHLHASFVVGTQLDASILRASINVKMP
jgi:hypothetical protein